MMKFFSTIFRLVLALAVSITAESEVTTDQLLEKITPNPPLPGFNVEGGSVFTNFAGAYNNGQFFFLVTDNLVYEKPGSDPVQFTFLYWCSDLTFSDFINGSAPMAYAGHCALKLLAGYAAAIAAGGQLPYDYTDGFSSTHGISSVFVEQKNIFEGQFHKHTDDFIVRFWEDGRKTMPMLGWEPHDEGDMHPSAASSSWSGWGEITWMSKDEVAQLLNTTTDEFTPEKFKSVYRDAWIKDHEEEAAKDNPFPEAELVLVEQVKNETKPVDEPKTPVQSGTEDEGDANPTEDDTSGTGRKLASVAARIVSLLSVSLASN